MSELYEGGLPFPSEDFTASAFESNRQGILREAFEEMTQINMKAIAAFDPLTRDAEQALVVKFLEEDQVLIDEEPILARMFLSNMLKQMGIRYLEGPEDSRGVFSRLYDRGVIIEIWYEQFENARTIPVYLRTKPGNDRMNIESLTLLSYMRAQQQKKDFEMHGALTARMVREMGMSYSEINAAGPFTLERLQEILTDFDEIQSL